MSGIGVLGEPVRITAEVFGGTVVAVTFFNGRPSTPSWAERLSDGLGVKYGRSRTAEGDAALPGVLRAKSRSTRLGPPERTTVWPTDSTMMVVLERDSDGAVSVEYHDIRRSEEQLNAAAGAGGGQTSMDTWPAASTDLVDAKGSLGGIKAFRVEIEGIDADATALGIRSEKMRDHVAELLRRRHIMNMAGKEFRDVKEPGVVGDLTVLVTAGRSASGCALSLSLQVRQVAALPFNAVTVATTWERSFLWSGDVSRLSARLDEGLDNLFDKFAVDYTEARKSFPSRASGVR